ncbi:MAG: IPTL-CTERM sorting domain-containing protein [Burkholderiales bacterium]|nr:IPTL-CTERM sorting domain-containing protein [Burkholderiales bacterium]
MQVVERDPARAWRATAFAAAIIGSASMSALAAPPDPPNAFDVGQFSSLEISGTQNIFSAGFDKAIGPNCLVVSPNAAGTLPTEIAVPPNARWVSFESVAETSPIGSVDFKPDPSYHSGDGWTENESTNIFGPYRIYAQNATGGWTLQMVDMAGDISGIKAPGSMFLTGVFRNSSEPTMTKNTNIRDYMPTGWTGGAIAPNMVAMGGIQNVFAKTNQDTYTDLLLNQSYWIGDGRNKFEVIEGAEYWSGTPKKKVDLGLPKKGDVQYFKIPEGATRLYLGFSDANYFYGPQGCYWDNPGALTVAGTFWGPKPPLVSVACDRTALVDAEDNVTLCTLTSDELAPEGGLSVAIALPGSDRYTSTCVSPLTIPENETTATCTITAVPNFVVGDGDVVATLTVLAGEGYAPGDPASAEVTIADDDKAVTTAGPTPIPTLSEWALILLSLGIAGFAARRRLR